MSLPVLTFHIHVVSAKSLISERKEIQIIKK